MWEDPNTVKLAIRSFKKLIPTARRTGVKLTIENHAGISYNPDNILRIVLGSDPEWVGTLPDLGNIRATERYQRLGKLFPYAYYVHIKTYEFTPEGEDTKIDVGRCIRMLKDLEYQGVIAIESEGAGEQYECVRKSKALIERYL
jgi:sugar phosphate isomerase/epimerase